VLNDLTLRDGGSAVPAPFNSCTDTSDHLHLTIH
jgi:hypothetical protein